MPQALQETLTALLAFRGGGKIRLHHRRPGSVDAKVLPVGSGKEGLVNGDTTLTVLMEERANGLNSRQVSGHG
jgi:hypothetical protein